MARTARVARARPASAYRTAAAARAARPKAVLATSRRALAERPARAPRPDEAQRGTSKAVISETLARPGSTHVTPAVAHVVWAASKAAMQVRCLPRQSRSARCSGAVV